MGARTTETNQQGRVGKTSYTNVHKANLGLQLSIFDTGSFARACRRPNAFTRGPQTTSPNDRNEPTKESRENKNVHKANLESQLSISDTGSFVWVRPLPNAPPERVHTGAPK